MPRRDFDRRAEIARTFCALAGSLDRRAVVMRQVAAWDRREARDETATLGYQDLGGEG